MSLTRSILVLLASLVWAGPTAWAQQTGVTGDLERVAQTSPQEKLQYAAEANEEMRQSIKDVTKILEGARKEGDLAKLQCLNNRLTAVRALLQVSEVAEVTMKEALAAGESERADHEFRKVAVARTKAQQLRAEAEQCVSEIGLKSGQTIVKADGELNKPSDETNELPEDLEFGYDPPEASPFI